MVEVHPRVARTARINLRVEPEADELLRYAASRQHKSLSAFLLDSALERAREVLEEDRQVVLQVEEFNRVLDELDRPAHVVGPLLRLAERVATQADSRQP